MCRWKSAKETIFDERALGIPSAHRTHGNVNTYNVHVFIWIVVYMNNKMLQKGTQYKTVEYMTVLSAINDHTILLRGIKSKVSYTSLLKQFCKSLHWTIGYQAIYTTLWLSVILGIPLSIVCCLKKWLVQVRIHNPVWKIFITVLISMNGKFFCSQPIYNSATRSAEQCHSREDFVQDEWYKIQE